jgi:hypothetical protein
VAGIAAGTGKDWSVRTLEVDRDGAVVRPVASGSA